MKQWFVVHTQACKESIAQKHLAEQGFDTYVPRFKKMRRHARRVEEILAPLFPRYIFVGFDPEVDHWRSIQSTQGVSYLLIMNNRPIIVPSAIIQGLKDNETGEGVVSIQNLALFARGDKVRVLDGVFKDYVAIFEKMDGKERVQLLLSCLGREINVYLPAYIVEAA
jgi:transcriptional antiterminator RfaH